MAINKIYDSLDIQKPDIAQEAIRMCACIINN